MNETVLITGGTGLIGESMVKAFAKHDYRVLFTSRSADKINSLQEIAENTRGIQCDFNNENFLHALQNFLNSNGEKVDHLVNNYRDAQNLVTNDGHPTPLQWQTEYHSAVIIPYDLSIYLANKHTLKTITNIGSIYGVVAANLNLYDGDLSKSPVHYSIAKAAQNHLTKELAVRLADRDIRVNSIAYGGVKGRAPQKFEEKYEKLCPYKGMLDIEDVPGAALFLVSDNAGRITGQVLNVDGGWTIW